MTITSAKIEANRRNARLSTGPRSPEGKEISARNALRHGMRAEKYLVPGEEEEFQNVLQELIDHYRPATALEDRAVCNIARCYLRLDRVARGEAELIADAPLEQFFGREQQTAKTLLHYETVIRKIMNQDFEALAQFQACRTKKLVPETESRAQVGRDTNTSSSGSANHPAPLRSGDAITIAQANQLDSTAATAPSNNPAPSVPTGIAASSPASDSSPQPVATTPASADNHHFTNEPKAPIKKFDTRLDASNRRPLPLATTVEFRDRPYRPNEAKLTQKRTVTRPGAVKIRLPLPTSLPSLSFAQRNWKPKAPFR